MRGREGTTMPRQVMWPTICNEVTWRLRRRITYLNKAKAGAAAHPNGMARLTVEGIDTELEVIRAELSERRNPRKPADQVVAPSCVERKPQMLTHKPVMYRDSDYNTAAYCSVCGQENLDSYCPGEYVLSVKEQKYIDDAFTADMKKIFS